MTHLHVHACYREKGGTTKFGIARVEAIYRPPSADDNWMRVCQAATYRTRLNRRRGYTVQPPSEWERQVDICTALCIQYTVGRERNDIIL